MLRVCVCVHLLHELWVGHHLSHHLLIDRVLQELSKHLGVLQCSVWGRKGREGEGKEGEGGEEEGRGGEEEGRGGREKRGEGEMNKTLTQEHDY